MDYRTLSLLLLAGCGDTVRADDCSSGLAWGGSELGELMAPGDDCIACHARDDGPSFTAAGTVMGAANDPLYCVGVEGVVVTITDANGQAHVLTTNEHGNFFTADPLPTPITAAVEAGGQVSRMTAPQMITNCASCHTETGTNGAPGRIVAP